LLKKQSRPQAKNKRVTASSTNVPTPAQGGSDAEEAEVEGEVGDAEDDDHGKPEPEMYRWVSCGTGLSFSIPVNFLPSPPEGTVADPASKVSGPKQIPLCDVSDCNERRKYRLVADMQKGACGMEHLRALEGKA
jgi:Ino eighty subunit 2